MTLSAADASAHLIENPNLRSTLSGHQVAITLFLLALLGAVFLRGFTEAIGLAVGLVGVYLALNVVVIGVGLWQIATHPHLVPDWSAALTQQHGNALAMVGVSLIVFPKLALGMSGFETGRRGDAARQRRPDRHRGTTRPVGSAAPSGSSPRPR